MNIKSFLTILLTCVMGFLLKAQTDSIKLEDIWANRTYSPEWVWGINSMNDGIHYSSISYNKTGTEIIQYAYETGDSTTTIVSAEDLDGILFQTYSFSPDENKILLATETEPIYRHSTQSKYFIYDRKSKTTKALSSDKQRLAQFAPDGTKIAFVRDNNLFIKNLVDSTEIQITTDGLENKIINGATDWVYEEEFSFDQGYQWNSTGTKIAYYKFNEELVPEFSMDVFQGLYPSQQRFKYPKAGENNAMVEIMIYDLNSDSTIEANIKTDDEFYIPRIKWTRNEEVLSVQRMNRHQNQLELLFVDAKNGSSEIICTEKDDSYIDVNDHLTFLKDDKHFLWTSEKSGYQHIYLYNTKGKQVRKITKGNFDVTEFYGVDEKTNTVYFASAERSPMHRDVYSVKINGKNKTLLTQNVGSNSATFSTNFNYFINQYSNASTPLQFTLYDESGTKIRTLKDNQSLREKLSDLALSEKEFFNFRTPEGTKLNGWMMKPHDFDTDKKYPVLMYVYGGPGSQMVKDSWGGSNFLWFQKLTQLGYIVACIDNRGTGARGAEFKKSTYLQLGALETIDQIHANKHLANLPYVDADRIGIFGWSYGGYLSSLCLLKGAEHFKMAIAVAPVTNWRYYDTIYTERYMRTPKENASGYDQNSPIHHVEKLKGNYLLIHGSADDNVHYQNTLEMTKALVNANKQFDLFIYPDKNHGIYGGNTRLHLFTKMTNYIQQKL